MEPVEATNDGGVTVSLPHQAWNSAVSRQEGSQLEHEQQAKAASLYKQQQASFLALIEQRRQDVYPAASAGPVASTGNARNKRRKNDVRVPGNKHLPILPNTRRQVSGNEHFSAIHTRMPPAYVLSEPTRKRVVLKPRPSFATTVQRGMSVVEGSIGSLTNSPFGGNVNNSATNASTKASPIITVAQRPSHKRKHSGGMEPLSSWALSSSSELSQGTTTPNSNATSRNTRIPPTRALVALEAVPPSLVHQACKLHARVDSIVKSAVQVDPTGVNRRLSSCKPTSNNGNSKKKRDRYDYPINIALDHGASLTVIELLANAGPNVLAEPDGPDECCAVACALVNKRGLDVISLLLQANLKQAQVCDRYKNCPLHTACGSDSCCLGVVKLLATAFPSALHKRNFHGQTPLDVAQWNSSLKDEVIDYLQQESFGSLEQMAIHLHEDSDS